MKFSFEVPGKPVPQGSMRSYGRGRMVHSNHEALLPWRDTVAAVAGQYVPVMWDHTGPMQIHATFTLPRPRNHYRANGELKPAAPFWVVTRPDLDKLTRALLDALTVAGIWGDDNQVVDLHARKTYGPPRLWCAVQHLPETENE